MLIPAALASAVALVAWSALSETTVPTQPAEAGLPVGEPPEEPLECDPGELETRGAFDYVALPGAGALTPHEAVTNNLLWPRRKVAAAPHEFVEGRRWGNTAEVRLVRDGRLLAVAYATEENGRWGVGSPRACVGVLA